MTLDELKQRREQEVAFLIGKLVLEKYFRADGQALPEKGGPHRFDAEVQAWLFPQVLDIVKRWLAECLTCQSGTFPQLLLLLQFAHDAADRVYRAIVAGAGGSH